MLYPGWRRASRWGDRRESRRTSLIAVLALLALALLVPSSALAGSRSLACQIAGAPNDPGGVEESFESLGGVAAGAAGDVWVAAGHGTGAEFDEFNPACGSMSSPVALEEPAGQAEAWTFPDSLGVEASTGRFYVTGERNREGFDPRVDVFEALGARGCCWRRPVCSPLRGLAVRLTLRSITRPI